MKTKSMIVALFFLGALSFFTSCKENNNSSKVEKAGLFGNLPQIYEDEMLKVVKGIKDLGELTEDNAVEHYGKINSMIQEAYEKSTEKAQPVAEQLQGGEIPYVLSEDVSYSIVSPLKIVKVQLPSENGFVNNMNTNIAFKVNFDAVVKPEVEKLPNLYYFIMDDDTPIGYGYMRTYTDVSGGDTLHISADIDIPDAPAKYVSACNALKFVSDSTYNANWRNLKDQMEQWDEEMKKMLGL